MSEINTARDASKNRFYIFFTRNKRKLKNDSEVTPQIKIEQKKRAEVFWRLKMGVLLGNIQTEPLQITFPPVESHFRVPFMQYRQNSQNRIFVKIFQGIITKKYLKVNAFISTLDTFVIHYFSKYQINFWKSFFLKKSFKKFFRKNL